MTAIEVVAKKFKALRSSLPERARRLWVGAEADALGRGGVAWVAKATGMAISTVRKGRDEVRSGVTPTLVRDRRPGGGRPRLEVQRPELLTALDELVNPVTRGDPESPLRWTCKSLRVLSRELGKKGLLASPTKLAELLQSAGYSLMANAKTKEGGKHPDRNEQFEFINAQAQDFISRGLPVVSVDAKKKEAIGEYANKGREWQRKGEAVEVIAHDFFDEKAPKAIPYGVYDVAKNLGFVNVGTDHNTPTFAVHSIEKWWGQMGQQRYPEARELFITADAGGSNSFKSRIWKTNLQKMADQTDLAIHVSHFPPGTSKWNKIEHRLFSFISVNWRGRPLETYETVVALIAGTTTSKGLQVSAELDSAKYPLGLSVSKDQMNGLRLQRSRFHGEWNYTLLPRTAAQVTAAAYAASAAPKSVSRAARKERWKELFREQKASGVSNRQFCKDRGINFSAYIWARRRILGRIQARALKDR